jgi:histidine triad (HIT) family protein
MAFLAGVAAGGYLFVDSQPRSLLRLHQCVDCLKPSELMGLVASVGIQRFPRLVPGVIMETDRTVVIQHPSPAAPVHYVVVPKKDMKNIGQLREEDMPYIRDALDVIRAISEGIGMTDYQVITNGPGAQQVTYLHFHLMGWPKAATPTRGA